MESVPFSAADQEVEAYTICVELMFGSEPIKPCREHQRRPTIVVLDIQFSVSALILRLFFLFASLSVS
jgi:hypothetical protein